MPDTKAIVVIARPGSRVPRSPGSREKLLVSIWYVLSRRIVDHRADPVRVATKFIRWSWELSDEQRGGMTSRQPVPVLFQGSFAIT